MYTEGVYELCRIVIVNAYVFNTVRTLTFIVDCALREFAASCLISELVCCVWVVAAARHLERGFKRLAAS